MSYKVPTLHSMFAIPAPEGANPHQPPFQAAAGTDAAHAEAMTVGSVLALVGWDVLVDDGLYGGVRDEWEQDIAKVFGSAVVR